MLPLLASLSPTPLPIFAAKTSSLINLLGPSRADAARANMNERWQWPEARVWNPPNSTAWRAIERKSRPTLNTIQKDDANDEGRPKRGPNGYLWVDWNIRQAYLMSHSNVLYSARERQMIVYVQLKIKLKNEIIDTIFREMKFKSRQ